jgi:hypothetical protein
MMTEEWGKEYVVTVRVHTDVGLDNVKSLKFWEEQSHSDESPYFLITEIIKVDERP